MKIGVLALQGDFLEHIQILESLKQKAKEVRTKEDLKECKALIIPGGESTTIGKLLKETGLDSEIKKQVKKGMSIYGTCAGAIVVAKKVIGEKEFTPLSLIDIEIKRNAYGRQIDSFETELSFNGHGKMNGVFIRAPKIVKKGKQVEVLGSLDGKPVLVKQGNVLVGTFHPETEHESKLHKMFLEMI